MKQNQISDQSKQAITVLRAIAETIRECGSAPEGVMYAAVTGKMSLDAFENALTILANAGLIRRSNHVATWTGPKA